MYKNWLLRGDCHGWFYWIDELDKERYKPLETAFIVLGDFGVNYYLNKKDEKKKQELCKSGYTFYVVRGNHEARPQDVPGMTVAYDQWIDGYVYMEMDYPNIRYFMDYGIYTLDGYSAAVIGGAYSIDKWWRLQRAGIRDKHDPNYENPKKSGWFWNEQLTAEEMNQAATMFKGKSFDFVLSHTCPRDWEPTDMFLSSINQNEVDKSMEIWMNEIKDTFDWHVWCFGHFHADRLERPHVEMYYHDIESLEDIHIRWSQYDQTGELDWWLKKSPMFYAT